VGQAGGGERRRSTGGGGGRAGRRRWLSRWLSGGRRGRRRGVPWGDSPWDRRVSGSWASVSGAGGPLFGGTRTINRHSSLGLGGLWGRGGVRRRPLNRSPLLGCDERFDDRGAATIWTAGGIAAVMVVVSGLLSFVAAVVTRHRAESAADLAALAAASWAVAGEERACAQARWVAEQMGVGLRSCRLSSLDALVEVVAEPAGVLGEFGGAAAKARAGPVAWAGWTRVQRLSADGERRGWAGVSGLDRHSPTEGSSAGRYRKFVSSCGTDQLSTTSFGRWTKCR
jgi:secretion/DNA translocation related TadE-like protein